MFDERHSNRVFELRHLQPIEQEVGRTNFLFETYWVVWRNTSYPFLWRWHSAWICIELWIYKQLLINEDLKWRCSTSLGLPSYQNFYGSCFDLKTKLCRCYTTRSQRWSAIVSHGHRLTLTQTLLFPLAQSKHLDHKLQLRIHPRRQLLLTRLNLKRRYPHLQSQWFRSHTGLHNPREHKKWIRLGDLTSYGYVMRWQ